MPGRVVVRLCDEVVERVKEEIPYARFHRQRRRAQRFGIDAVDLILRHAGTHSIRRLFRQKRSGKGLFGYYVVRFDRNQGVRRIQAELKRLGMILSACPDYYRCLLSGGGGEATMQEVQEAIDWPEHVATDASLPRPVVAVIDTGVQMTPPHPNLRLNTIMWRDMVDFHGDSLPPGWFWDSEDLQEKDDEPIDEVGHGTHVAGIIAGSPLGTFSGIAPQAQIMAIRTLARTVRGFDGLVSAYGSSSTIAAAVDFAVQQGAEVINMSFGFERQAPVEKNAIDRARARGCVVLAAIGNDGSVGPPLYPAKYSGVLAIGAVNRDGSTWSGSQSGSHLFVMAPGKSILSCELGGGFGTRTGTSMACAVVSGVVALMKSVQPNLTPEQVARILRQAAIPGNVHDNVRGWGIVNARQAVQAARS